VKNGIGIESVQDASLDRLDNCWKKAPLRHIKEPENTLQNLCTRIVQEYRIRSDSMRSGGFSTMSYEKALNLLTRDDRFRATIYAMNTLLIHKGIYTQEEFQQLVVEWASKQERKPSKAITHVSEVSA
jgi:hypothetical protein